MPGGPSWRRGLHIGWQRWARWFQARPRRAIAVLSSPDVLAPEGAIENATGDSRRVRVGRNSLVRGRLLALPNGRISIGDWCYVGERSEIWSSASITIGDHVLIAHDVNILDNTSHSLDATERHAHFRTIMSEGLPADEASMAGIKSAPIVIEDDVWIGFGAVIFRGVRIGRGSVVAARSIVDHDVPADSLYRNDVTPILRSLERDDGGSDV